LEILLLNTATQDGKPVRIGFGQDPGQAGKSQALHLIRALSAFTVRRKTPARSGIGSPVSWISDGHRWDSSPKIRFALDSPLEEAGFEPSVPGGWMGVAVDKSPHKNIATVWRDVDVLCGSLVTAARRDPAQKSRYLRVF
jgi:hypothetical protein